MSDILTLTQWLSPAFPVGAFAFSHGVENAVREGSIRDASGLEDWLNDLLEHGSGKSDVVLLSTAYKSKDAEEVQRLALAFQSSRERVEETSQLGAAFCRTVRDVWAIALRDLCYPVAIGRAARLRGMPLEDTAALYAQAFVTNLVSAAIRIVPLGQTEGQAVVAHLQDKCRALGEAATTFTPDDLASSTFLSDVHAMRHETLSPRIFQS
ncbi:MAG: urease accessory protein UreF [Pseudomonadota bacterium]